MAWSLVDYAVGDYWSTASTLDTTDSLNVAAGDLLVAYVGFDTTSRAISSIQATSGNANAMTVSSISNINTTYGAIAYKINADANATATFRLTLDGTANQPGIVVMQFRPDSGDTVTLDSGPSGTTGTSETPTSASFNTAGTDEVVVCGRYAHYKTGSAQKVGSDNADAAYSSGTEIDVSAWYKILNATKSGITCQETIGYADWVCDYLAFKATAPAGGSVVPKIVILRRRDR